MELCRQKPVKPKPGEPYANLPFYIHFWKKCPCAQSLQSCLTLCDPMDCSLQGSFIYGILQARILEWVAIPSSRGSSWPRDQTWVPRIVGRVFITEPTGKEMIEKVPMYCSRGRRNSKRNLWPVLERSRPQRMQPHRIKCRWWKCRGIGYRKSHRVGTRSSCDVAGDT